MDTYTLFTRTADHFPVHLLLWGFLVITTAMVFYWAATIKNDIENNPDDSRLS